MHTHIIPKIIPQIIAHRGASDEAPENTLPAIQRAIDIGADCIEFDVRLTKDNIPIIIHDETLSRVTGSKCNDYVHDLTLNEIKNLDVGSWRDPQFSNLTIPTLEEVLNLTSNQINLMIEIKECIQPPKTIVTEILKTVKSSQAALNLLTFGSFNIPIIEEILKFPSLNIIGIIEENDKVQDFINLNIMHLALWYKIISPDLIHRLKNKDINVWTFTVDDPEIARFLTTLSVQGIITNQPRYIKQFYQ